mmetsp:Transcript_28601/g.44480  ORF Transcript_28601/g.44480 Transcript_28601/m.44480 type:complete len:111 (+) Transcript_28601:103-435(+)
MGSSSSKSSNMADIKTSVETEIASNKVVVFSKSYCPYCSQTKSTFAGIPNANAKVIELDQVPGGSEMQQYLMQKTGQRTVPNVFVNGKHLGGNDDTQAALSSGKLTEMLA